MLTREDLDADDEDPKPFLWPNADDQILASVRRIRQDALDTHADPVDALRRRDT